MERSDAASSIISIGTHWGLACGLVKVVVVVEYSEEELLDSCCCFLLLLEKP